MDAFRPALLLMIASTVAFCQASPPAGMENPWDIAPVMKEIAAHNARLTSALEKIDARSWVEKGAPETYAEQVQSTKVQTSAIASQAQALAAKPEQLALSIEVLFRMQSVETMLASVEAGIRKYDSPAAAQALASLAAEGGANRSRFQNYIVSLAADRERALVVMDKEAQRCRGILSPTAPAATAKTGKKK